MIFLDSNARCTNFNDSITNSRGNLFKEFIISSNFNPIHDFVQPTFQSFSPKGGSSFIDFILVNNNE